MRKGTKIALFTGLGIFAAGIIIAVIAFGLNGFRFSKWPAPVGTAAKAKLQKVEATIDIPFDNVRVFVVDADIKIQKSTDEKCHLVYKDRGKNPIFYSTVENGTLVFTQEEEFTFDWKRPSEVLEHLANQINHINELENVDIVISLPEKAYQKLEIATVSGEIEAKQELVFAEVSVTDVSGDVDIKNLTDIKKLSIDNTSGEIDIADMTISDDLKITTVSGDVALERLPGSGKATVSTVTGNIKITNSGFTSGNLETTSGDIYLEEILAEQMDVETTSGDVKGRLDSSINVQTETVSGDVSVPHGYAGNWKVKTVSGDIKLEY